MAPPIERRKGMGRPISRRSFLKKSALALGTVTVCDLEAVCSIVFAEKKKEETMPHVIVKLYPGRSEQQKIRLAEQIVKDVVDIIKCGEESVSVAIEEIKPGDWAEKVYKPDILNAPGKLYKKPGYSM
jgi:4-oxalocrotonate tautomerase